MREEGAGLSGSTKYRMFPMVKGRVEGEKKKKKKQIEIDQRQRTLVLLEEEF